MLYYTSLIFFVPRKPVLCYSSEPFTGPRHLLKLTDRLIDFDWISSLEKSFYVQWHWKRKRSKSFRVKFKEYWQYQITRNWFIIRNVYICCGGQINIPVSANFWNIGDWQRIRQEWTNQGCCFERPNFIMANRNRKSVRRTIAESGWWSLEQDLVAGAGLDSWYKTSIRWIDGHWCRNVFRWCRKMVAGLGLVSAGAGRWSVVQG